MEENKHVIPRVMYGEDGNPFDIGVPYVLNTIIPALMMVPPGQQLKVYVLGKTGEKMSLKEIMDALAERYERAMKLVEGIREIQEEL